MLAWAFVRFPPNGPRALFDRLKIKQKEVALAISGNALTLTQKPSGAVLKLTRLE